MATQPITQQQANHKVTWDSFSKQSEPLVQKHHPLVLSVWGRGGVGKTYLGLTASYTSLVSYFNFDLNEAGAMSYFVGTPYEKNIIQFRYPPRLIHDYDSSKKTLDKFFNESDSDPGDFNRALALDTPPASLRNGYTLVIDTATALKQLVQDVEVYDPESIKRREMRRTPDPQPLDYREANNLFQYILNQVKMRDHNLIIIHRAREIWSRDERGAFAPSGTFVADQHASTEYMVNMDVRLSKVKNDKTQTNELSCTVMKCSAKKLLEGVSFPLGVYDMGFLKGIAWNDTTGFSEDQMEWWAKMVQRGVYNDSTGEPRLTEKQAKDYKTYIEKAVEKQLETSA